MWRKVSKTYAKTVNGLCERCLKNGDVVPYKIVHHKVHITPENINNTNITLHWSNLECLCQSCHNKEHHGEECEVNYYFDENGMPQEKEND